MSRKLCLIFLLPFLFFGCTKKENMISSQSIKITDYANRELILEKPAERIVIMADNAFMVVHELCALDKIVGVDSKTKGYWDLYLASETNPELAALPDVGKTKNPNYELILSLNPDLILLKGNKESADILQDKTGVPVANILSKTGYDFEIYNIIGKLLGKEKESKAVISELQSRKEKLENLLTKVTDKKSAYIVKQNSKNYLFKTLKNADSLTLASINNVAADASKTDEWGFADISKEEFLNWNPDFIILDMPTSSSAITKQMLSEDETYNFQNAIKENKIYHTHSFSCPKDYVFVIAEAYYYANIAYPEILSEKEYKAAINSLFEKTYGIKNYYEEWKASLD